MDCKIIIVGLLFALVSRYGGFNRENWPGIGHYGPQEKLALWTKIINREMFLQSFLNNVGVGIDIV